MTTQLYCITLWQPWASWIALGWKTIESRTHAHFAMLENRYVGIHAGLRWDKDAIGLASEFLTLEQQHATEELRAIRGAIVAHAHVRGHRQLHAIDSEAALIDCTTRKRYGLLLDDVTPLVKPIPYKGAQGIWTATVDLR